MSRGRARVLQLPAMLSYSVTVSTVRRACTGRGFPATRAKWSEGAGFLGLPGLALFERVSQDCTDQPVEGWFVRLTVAYAVKECIQ